MDEYIIEHIDTCDFTPKAIAKSFSRAYGIMRKTRGYSSDSKAKKHLKRMAHKRVRGYFKAIVSGRRGSFHPVTGWDVL